MDNNNEFKSFPLNYFLIYLNLVLAPNKTEKVINDLEKKKYIFKDNDNYIKYCYFFKEIVYEILYQKEKNIPINNKIVQFNFYFYLTRLIECKATIINFEYNFDFINDLNKANKCVEGDIKKIINSNIILILILNYKNNEEITPDNKTLKKLEDIQNSNIENINNFINNHKEIELEEFSKSNKKIENISIDKIYFKLIKYLIKIIKSENYNYAYEIINNLDLENIFIIDAIIEKLSEYLNEESNIVDYTIEKIEDLFNSKNIEFYYILFKYIFKETSFMYNFMYNITFIMNLRKKIIKAIKDKEYNLSDIIKNKDNKVEYQKKILILKRIIDLDYYKKIIDEKLNINKSTNESNTNSKDDNKNQNSESTNNTNSNNNKTNSNKPNDNSNEFKKIINDILTNSKYTINFTKNNSPSISLEDLVITNNGDSTLGSKYSKIQEYIKEYPEDENSKNFKKLEIFIENVVNRIKINSKFDYNFNIELNFNNFVRNGNVPNTHCIYKVIYFNPNKTSEQIKEQKFKENNILKNKTKSNSNGFEIMLDEIKCYIKKLNKLNKINEIDNIKNELIEFIYGIKNKENKDTENSDSYIKEWNNLEKSIQNKKIKKIRKDIKHKLFKYFEDINNREKLLKIFSQDQIDLVKNEGTKYSQKQNLKEIKQYYQNYFPESKKKDIKLIEEIIKNNKEIDEKYLNDYEIAQKMNLRKPMIYYLNKNNINQTISNNEKEIQNSVNKWNKIEKIINDETIIDNMDIFKDIRKYFVNKDNKENITKIFSKDKYEYIINILENEKFEIDIVNERKEKKDNKEQKEENKYEINEIEKKINDISLVNYKINYYKKNDESNDDITLENLVIGKPGIKLGSKYFKIKEYIEKNAEDNISKNFKSIEEFITRLVKAITKCFDLNYNLIIELIIVKKNNDNNSDFVCNKYIFYPPNNKEKIIFKENQFNELISEINSEKYEYKNEESKYNLSETGNNISDEQQNIKILQFEEIIGNHNEEIKYHNTAEFIKELSNHYFVSGGTDNKINIYNKEDFSRVYINEQSKDIFSDIKDWTYNICEKSGNEEDTNNTKNKIEIITCSNKEIILIILDFLNNKEVEYKIKKYELPDMTCTNCIKMSPTGFIIIGLSNSFYFTDIFDNSSITNMSVVKEKTFRDGIKINDYLIALTSNKVAVNGEDNLLLYNINSDQKKQISKIGDETNYSFNFSINTMALINIDNKKILLCSCKKYFPGQNNGILLFNPELEFEDKSPKQFIDTKYFEVYCICPIEYEYKDGIINKYFLIGGFDEEKEEGQIKLYKLIINKYNKDLFEIEFIQDIEFEKNDKFGGFEGPISSLIQSKYKRNILASCYDGNVYKFSPINLDKIIDLELTS